MKKIHVERDVYELAVFNSHYLEIGYGSRRKTQNRLIAKMSSRAPCITYYLHECNYCQLVELQVFGYLIPLTIFRISPRIQPLFA